jgi:hypothetical protein
MHSKIININKCVIHCLRIIMIACNGWLIKVLEMLIVDQSVTFGFSCKDCWLNRLIDILIIHQSFSFSKSSLISSLESILIRCWFNLAQNSFFFADTDQRLVLFHHQVNLDWQLQHNFVIIYHRSLTWTDDIVVTSGLDLFNFKLRNFSGEAKNHFKHLYHNISNI